MKKLPIILIVFALLAAWTVPALAITWGEPDTTHPNVGAMVVDRPDYGPWQWCSGTLIHPQVFLTAGHCTDRLEEDYGITTVWVNFEPYALAPGGLRLVAEVYTHPDYAWSGSNPHDGGILVLAEPVTGITPAELPSEDFLDNLKKSGELRERMNGAPFTVVGYGGSLNWPPPDIYYEDYRQVAVSEYVALTKPWLHMSQQSLVGNGGTCFGDSGGPGFYTREDGSEVLVGITSWGDAQCVATSFDYRVDIPETLEFIQEVIDSLEG